MVFHQQWFATKTSFKIFRSCTYTEKICHHWKKKAGVGFPYCTTFPQEGTVSRVLQITKNELCWEHWNHKKTHFHDNQENLCTAVLSIFPFCKTPFFNYGLFLFKELSKIFNYFCVNLKDFSRISHNFSIFEDLMLFQGLFKTHANHTPSWEKSWIRTWDSMFRNEIGWAWAQNLFGSQS